MTKDARRSIATSPALLWSAFVLVHLWLGAVNLFGPGVPLGDVSIVYRFWTDQGIISHYWVGIDVPWVYPIVALVPMLAARAFGVAQYSATWLAMIMLLDAVAFAVIIGWGHRRQNSGIAWWWLGFLLLLGPIALGRIDSVTIPIAIVGVLIIASRPRAAIALLTIATWIKVWPAAIVFAAFISVRDRVALLVTATLTSVAIVAAALALGGGPNVFSFITAQTSRGLQVEAPVSAMWLWRAFAGAKDAVVYYDTNLLTWEIKGAGVDVASSLMSPLLAIVVIAVLLLGVAAVRNRAPVEQVFPSLSLAIIAAFIDFNKVGSPQYITWFAVVVILGLATRVAGWGRSFRVPAIVCLAIAGLTQIVYPYLYNFLLELNPLMLLVITAKDVLLFALLAWATLSLWRLARAHVPLGEVGGQWLAPSSPFPADYESERASGPTDRPSGANRDRLDVPKPPG